MNIPDDDIINSPKDNAIVINEPRIFRGVLTTAQVWGSTGLGQTTAVDTEELDEIMVEFAVKIADLRAKYEVDGDTLNGESALEGDYYDELNILLAKYRTLLFNAAMDYVSDDIAIDLMTGLLFDKE